MIFEARLFKVPPHTEFSQEALENFIGVDVKPVGSGTIINAWEEGGWIMVQVEKHNLTGITRDYRKEMET